MTRIFNGKTRCFPLPTNYTPAEGEFDLRELEVCFNLNLAVTSDDISTGSGKSITASWRAAYNQGLISIVSGLTFDGTAYTTHDLGMISIRVLTKFPRFGSPTDADFGHFTLVELEEWAARCFLERRGLARPALAVRISEFGDEAARRAWYALITGLFLHEYKGGPHVMLDDTLDG